MGSWDGRCAITQVAIRWRQPVYAFIYRTDNSRTWQMNTNGLNRLLWRCHHVTAPWSRDGDEFDELCAYFGLAHYNDYGWVERGVDLEPPSREDNLDIWMVHAAVAQAVHDRMLQHNLRHGLFQVDNILCSLTNFANLTRTQLFELPTDHAGGAQSGNEYDEMDLHLFRADLIRVAVKEFTKGGN